MGATPVPPRPRLGAGDWARAALAAMGEGGLAAVAVEPLATRLGATKGSFYWHFANREALVEAALRLWEGERTEAVIQAMDDEPDAEARLRRLLATAVGAGVHDRVEVALLATADHPLVAPVLERVTERRIGYLAQTFSELGLGRAQARSQGLLAYSVYLGYIQLAHATPGVLPAGREERQMYLERVITALLPTGC